jgi:hypothetical protein
MYTQAMPDSIKSVEQAMQILGKERDIPWDCFERGRPRVCRT